MMFAWEIGTMKVSFWGVMLALWTGHGHVHIPFTPVQNEVHAHIGKSFVDARALLHLAPIQIIHDVSPSVADFRAVHVRGQIGEVDGGFVIPVLENLADGKVSAEGLALGR